MIDVVNKGFGKYVVMDHVTNIPYRCNSKAEMQEKVAELKAKYETKETPDTNNETENP